MKIVKNSKSIKIDFASEEVTITTSVGNGNRGGGNVKNETGQKIATGLLKDFNLGVGSDLQGKTYVVTVNVLDINPFRDDTPISHEFSGKALSKKVSHDFTEVADSDGIVAFITEYSFT